MSSQPIAWDEILKQPTKLTPKSVRAYLTCIVEKLNHYLAFIMNGPNICKIRLTRDQLEDVITIAQAKQLFPQMVNIRWIEKKKEKIFFKNVIDVFLMSSNRKEIYHEHSLVQVDLLVKKWLKHQLSSENCPLIWDGLNPRNLVYKTYLDHIPNANDYTPKKISQEIYRLMPICRPTKRIRSRGVSMIYIPSRDYCQQVISQK